MKMLFRFLFCFLVAGHAMAAAELPKYDEVYNLLRTHLGNVTVSNLDQASVQGLLQQLKSKVVLVEGAGTNNSTPVAALGKALVYDDSFVCFQFARVEGDVAAKLLAAYSQLAQSNKTKIKGVVLDLRFASGSDYAAAAAVADCFLSSDQPLLDWGKGSIQATKKTNAISVPVAVLVNAQTTGSAEALAAVLRDTSTGLLIGNASAGQASVFSEFPLSNGEKLRIATAQVKSANGKVLAEPLKPDIGVDTSLEDEKAYFADAYKTLHPPGSAKSGDSETNSTTVATNRPARRRYNEATLVREQREGAEPDDDLPAKKPELDRSVVVDPALARALDLLKGLAVVQRSRPG